MSFAISDDQSELFFVGLILEVHDRRNESSASVPLRFLPERELTQERVVCACRVFWYMPVVVGCQ